jgi:7-cyano-7-deazaguanine synthase in queuosine biosynthesis
MNLDALIAAALAARSSAPRSTDGAILFSGGLDSVGLAILLKRQGHDLVPLYGSHRSNVGNVTRKEVQVAGELAREILGRDLVIAKPRAKGREAPWYAQAGEVVYTKRLPVTKARKPWRNRILLDVAADLGLGRTVAVGVFGDPHDQARAADVDKASLQRHLRKRVRGATILTPPDLSVHSKADLIRQAGKTRRERDWLTRSESCLMYFNTPCGDCWSCKDRAEAFLEAWGYDPTPYRPSSTAGRMVKQRSRR